MSALFAADKPKEIRLDWATYNPVSMLVKDKGWLEKESKCLDGRVNEGRAVIDRHDVHAFGQAARDLADALLDVVDDIERVGAEALQHDAAGETSACLSPAQINAVKKINDGPRNSLGERIRAPAGAAVREHADNTALGYAYDGGFMAPTGIPAGKIGTPTTTPIDFVLGLRNFPYVWLTPPDPGFNPLRFDFDKPHASRSWKA